MLNGDLPENLDCDFLICADGGYDYLIEKNIKPDVLLGDMDSVRSVVDMDIIKYDSEKNETDGELCLNYLLDRGYKDIVIYGAFGGRPDHELGNYSLMYKAFCSGAKVKCVGKDYEAYLSNKQFLLNNAKNKTISVLPFIDEVHINGATGLKYPMDNLTITKCMTRGISNLCVLDKITIDIVRGVAIIFVINRG